MKQSEKLNQQKVAGLLLDCGCLKLSPNEPFSYASGLQGPIYCDNRLLLSFPKARQAVVDSLVELCRVEKLEKLMIAGVASAGVPHAAFMAQILQVPMLYVRSQKKGHGRQNRVEGLVKTDDTVLVVEDLVNQGGSVCDAVEALREEGLMVEHIVCLVSYQLEKAQELLKSRGVKLHYLCDFETICEVALERNLISEAEYEILQDWHDDPQGWQKK